MQHIDEGGLHAYLDGALDAYPQGEAEAIRSHLEQCAECARRLDQARGVRGRAQVLLDSVAPASPAMPSLEELRIRARAEGSAPAGGLRPMRRVAWAASVVLALGTGWMLRDQAPRLVEEGASAATASGEVGGGLAQGATDPEGEATAQTEPVAEAELAEEEGATRVPQVPQAAPPEAEGAVGATRREVARLREDAPGAEDGMRVRSAAPPAGASARTLEDVARSGALALDAIEVTTRPASADDRTPTRDATDSRQVELDRVAGDARRDSLSRWLLDARTVPGAGRVDTTPAVDFAPVRLTGLPAAGRPLAKGSAASGSETAADRAELVRGPVRSLAPERGPATVVSGVGRSGDEAPAAPAREIRGGPGSLVVPGIEVLSVAWLEEEGARGAVRVHQLLADGDTLELIHIPQGVEPAAVTPPEEEGVSMLLVARTEGWLLLRARGSVERLRDQLAALDAGTALRR